MLYIDDIREIESQDLINAISAFENLLSALDNVENFFEDKSACQDLEGAIAEIIDDLENEHHDSTKSQWIELFKKEEQVA